MWLLFIGLKYLLAILLMPVMLALFITDIIINMILKIINKIYEIYINLIF